MYTTNSCRLPPFPSKEVMTRCLAGRKIFLLGNSIARQFAYHVPILLGSTEDVPDRQSQIENCPNKEFGRSGCLINAPFNVTVQTFWLLYWNGKPTIQVYKPTGVFGNWGGDVCGTQGVVDCLEKTVFREFRSQASDLLLTNVGIIYTQLDPTGMRGHQDLVSWREGELRSYIRALDNHFNGTVVWMTQSKMAASAAGRDWMHLYEDVRMQQLDADIVPIILKETNWLVYDGYHITEPLAYNKEYFVDTIHHPGRLTHLGWQFILGHFCPDAPQVA